MEINSLIIASILGDGYITRPKIGKGNPYLSIQHSGKQIDYLKHKHNVLSRNQNTTKIYNVSKNGYVAYRFNVNNPELFKYLKYQFYPNKNKTITRKLLNHLDKEGLAWWFMDDGSCIKRYKQRIDKKGIYGNGRYLQLCTNSFTLEEHRIIKRYFKNIWNIDCMIKTSKRKHRQVTYFLTFNVKNSYKLIELIEPYVIPSMLYKIDFEYDLQSSKERPNSEPYENS